MVFRHPKGVFDLLPLSPDHSDQWRNVHLWQHLEQVIATLAFRYRFEEIRTPIFEFTELFARSVGEETDIVSKEMYTFEDRAQRSLTLRPEGTAPLLRAILQQGLHLQGAFQKYYYIGPMFRYERQQAGRYRQHHQFGAEIIGDPSPERDAELIAMLLELYQELGLSGLTLHLNSLGDQECRDHFREALVATLQPKRKELSDEGRLRLDRNPLRLLDSKEEGDLALLEEAPSILEFLEPPAKEHFDALCETLEALSIPYTINPRLVRGLDYYNRTVFEITSSHLGAQNSLGGGGRYDHLFHQLGGPEKAAIGFGTGLERILQAALDQKVPFPDLLGPTLLIIPLGERARRRAFLLAQESRSWGVSSEVDLTGRRLKGALRNADQVQAEFVVILGEDELAEECCEIKAMRRHTSEKIPLKSLRSYINV